MTNLVPKVPEPIELVTTPDLAARFESERVTLTELVEHAASLRATATDLERRVAAERIDADIAGWMVMRFQRFLVEWREEAEAEAVALLTGARQRAAQVRRADRPIPLALTGALAARRSVPDVLPVLPDALIRWTPADAVAPRVPVMPVVIEVPVMPVVIEAPVMPAVTEAWAPAMVPAASVVDPLVTREPALVDLLAEASLDESGELPDDPEAARDFWPHEGRRSGPRRRRASAAVLLQVFAGLIAIAAVAVRFV